jgi:Ammonium Transporter Family
MAQITMNLGKRHLSIFQHVDDCLDVFHTHFVAALVGGFFTGIFAVSGGTFAFEGVSTGGAVAGYGKQVWLQIVGALFIIGWDALWTSLILLFIQHVLRIPLRMSDEMCAVGDYAVHEEESYTFAYYNRNLLTTGKDSESGVAIEGQIPPELAEPIHPKLAANPRIAPPPAAQMATQADITVAQPSELAAEKNGNGKQD